MEADQSSTSEVAAPFILSACRPFLRLCPRQVLIGLRVKMDIGKTIFNVALQCWDCIGKYQAYMRSLEDNLAALGRKKDELKLCFEDVN